MVSSAYLVRWTNAHATLRDIGISQLLDERHQPRRPPNPRFPDQKARDSQPDTEILTPLQYTQDLTIALADLVWCCEQRDIDVSRAKAVLAIAIVRRKKKPGRQSSIREVILRDVNVALNMIKDEARNGLRRKREEEETPEDTKRARLHERVMGGTTLEDTTAHVAALQAATGDIPSGHDQLGALAAPPKVIFAKHSELNVVAESQRDRHSEEETLAQEYDADNHNKDKDHDLGAGFDCEDDIYEEEMGAEQAKEEDDGDSGDEATDDDLSDDGWDDDDEQQEDEDMDCDAKGYEDMEGVINADHTNQGGNREDSTWAGSSIVLAMRPRETH